MTAVWCVVQRKHDNNAAAASDLKTYSTSCHHTAADTALNFSSLMPELACKEEQINSTWYPVPIP